MMIDGRFRTEPEIRAYIGQLKEEKEEATRLLKTAIEEIEPREKSCTVCAHAKDGSDKCKECVDNSYFTWRHSEEAKKLLARKEGRR